MCTDIERSPFSHRSSQGQIAALRMGRLEGRHCCSGACVQPKSALRTRSVPRARLPETDGLLGPSVLCVSNSESYCVRISRGYFNCLATGESFKLDGLLLPVFRRLLCSLCEIEDPCAAARFAVGSADRLLAVYLVQFVRLAAKRLVGKSLQLRKKYAGLLLNSIKHAKSIQLEAKSDFGKGCCTRSTEPYFYEAAYLYVRNSLSL